MDNVTIAEMFIILLTTTFIITILIVYLSNVLPWTTSRPQPLLFPIMPSYWFPPAFATTATGIEKHENAARFEPLPQLDVVIECKNLVKVFGGTVALNKVNITTYKSQVTILLGHNGAGKTTLMSILTGLIEPNSGLVLVSGKDIRTTGFERMGFCPQFDALFADLTVSEHLSYFGGVKFSFGCMPSVPNEKLMQHVSIDIRGLHSDVILTTTTKLLQAVRLSDKADAFPEELSGGMKRKLSIALALLTSPEVLILDEPTAALDPETRRSIWSLIKELGGDASILLSTHDMEEADVLGDRIIVMYNGSVISWGSPSFLKNACGVGYKLRIQKEQKAFKSDAVLALVKKTVPQAIIEDEKENEAIIALHTMEIRGFPAMFRELEGRSKGLGIKSTGVSVATMQDAYVKIYTEWVGGRKDVHIPNAGTR
ncbi:phospholipid-transporting ATPase ABCA3-like [Rhipicephalus microplus]|uniref:phospholipid-transporting ATPase ABCA3-like n=1 Tax=Rhipicephalus microplus TaxID=6941 RepID=UPI003F6B7A76